MPVFLRLFGLMTTRGFRSSDTSVVFEKRKINRTCVLRRNVWERRYKSKNTTEICRFAFSIRDSYVLEYLNISHTSNLFLIILKICLYLININIIYIIIKCIYIQAILCRCRSERIFQGCHDILRGPFKTLGVFCLDTIESCLEGH